MNQQRTMTDQNNDTKPGTDKPAPEQKPDSGSQAPPDSNAMIQADRLSKFYGNFAAVRNVSFSIPRGQIVAFLGPNGAGKSTTMKLLTGYLAPSEGRAFIAGHDMGSDRLAGATKLGYLPENGPLYPDMTPREMLSFFARTRMMTPAVARHRIDVVIHLCDLGAVIGKPISKLSKGYRQRVGMGLALLHEPDVLILDEPTAGLDPNQIEEVRNTIRQLGKNKTILLSTHILQEVRAIASRVILINEGQLELDCPIEKFDPENKGMDQRFREITQMKKPATSSQGIQTESG